MDSYTDVIPNKLLHQHKRFPESQALQDVCLLSCPKILSDKTTPFCTKGDSQWDCFLLIPPSIGIYKYMRSKEMITLNLRQLLFRVVSLKESVESCCIINEMLLQRRDKGNGTA